MKDEFKMSEEQKRLFDDLTRLQQEICTNSLSGMKDIDAYKASSGKAKNVKTMEASVSEILSNPKVKLFLDAMKQTAVSDAVMSRTRMLELQTQIADIGNDQMDKMNLEALNELKGALDVKLKAMNQLADLAGYKSAAKYDHTSSDGSMTPVQLTAEQAAQARKEMLEKDDC